MKSNNEHYIYFLSFLNTKQEFEKFKGIQIDEKIGYGGEGVIYKSKPLEDDQVYAIKLIKIDTLDDNLLKFTIDRLIKEYVTFKNIKHQNLIS